MKSIHQYRRMLCILGIVLTECMFYPILSFIRLSLYQYLFECLILQLSSIVTYEVEIIVSLLINNKHTNAACSSQYGVI